MYDSSQADKATKEKTSRLVDKINTRFTRIRGLVSPPVKSKLKLKPEEVYQGTIYKREEFKLTTAYCVDGDIDSLILLLDWIKQTPPGDYLYTCLLQSILYWVEQMDTVNILMDSPYYADPNSPIRIKHQNSSRTHIQELKQVLLQIVDEQEQHELRVVKLAWLILVNGFNVFCQR